MQSSVVLQHDFRDFTKGPTFIHLLVSEYILDTRICQTLCKALGIHSKQMDENPYLRVARILMVKRGFKINN